MWFSCVTDEERVDVVYRWLTGACSALCNDECGADNWTEDVSFWHSTLQPIHATQYLHLATARRRAVRRGVLEGRAVSNEVWFIARTIGPWHELWQGRSTVNAAINDLPQGHASPRATIEEKGPMRVRTELTDESSQPRADRRAGIVPLLSGFYASACSRLVSRLSVCPAVSVHSTSLMYSRDDNNDNDDGDDNIGSWTERCDVN